MDSTGEGHPPATPRARLYWGPVSDTYLAAWTVTMLGQHVQVFADGFASKGIAPSEYFVLPRSTWAGVWRHSAGLWSGEPRPVTRPTCC